MPVGSVIAAQAQRNNNRPYPNLTSWADVARRKFTITGDSIGVGSNSSPIATANWFYLFCTANSFAIRNLSISGQQLVNDGANPPYFDPSTIPVWDDSQGVYVMALGVNDARHSTNTTTYRANLKTAIQQALTNGWPANRILIMGPYWLNGDISAYTAQCLSVAQELHTMYIDTKAAIAAACNPATQYIDVDNIHPTTAGHIIIQGCIQAASLTPQ